MAGSVRFEPRIANSIRSHAEKLSAAGPGRFWPKAANGRFIKASSDGRFIKASPNGRFIKASPNGHFIKARGMASLSRPVGKF